MTDFVMSPRCFGGLQVDAIATARFDAQTGADREVQRILMELLNQMDGFDQTVNVKVSSWDAKTFIPCANSMCRHLKCTPKPCVFSCHELNVDLGIIPRLILFTLLLGQGDRISAR